MGLVRGAFVFLMLCVFSIDAYKILLVFPIPGRSLSLLGEAFVRHLLDDGNEITLITPFPLKNKPQKNFRQIDVSSLVASEMSSELYTISYLMDNKDDSLDPFKLQQLGVEYFRVTLEHENVLNLLKDTTQEFDAVVADLFESDLLAGFAAYYDCPMIWSYSLGIDWSVSKLIHGPTNPAYTIDYVSKNILPLSFSGRVRELWTQLHGTLIERLYMVSQDVSIYERIFGPLFAKKGKPMPPFESLVYNASLVFGNSHHAMGDIPPLPQNFKLIGGFHIDTPASLPEDLQNLMDNTKYGVIYFSMGSMFKSETMPKWLVDDLLKMFGQFKETVLWKFEADLENVPKNVHTVKWAPQHSILAHPKCLMFITHGGLLSSTEAVHFGVPTIGIPVFMDQFVNVRRAAAKGYTIQVDITRQLTKDLSVAINEMLANPSYRAKVKELSAIYHSRPTSPAKELVHWVRHVVETRGAPHLRSPGLMVPWYQKLYLDLLVLIVIVLCALWKLIKMFCRGNKANVAVDKKRD